MQHRLSVSPDGLSAAAAALDEHAGQPFHADGIVPRGGKASIVGAAGVSAAIAAFGSAYASRLADHGQTAVAAGTTYTVVDDEEATDIGSVSV